MVGGEVSVGGVWISVEVESGVIIDVDSGVGSEVEGLQENKSILPAKINRNRKGKALGLRFIDFIEN